MEKQERIPPITGFLMLGLAIIFDGLQFILNLTVFLSILATAVALIGWGILWLWLKFRHVTFSNNTIRMATVMLSPLIELVPFINMLPALTFGTWITIWSVRREDKKRNKEISQRKAVENKRPTAYYNRGAANDNVPLAQNDNRERVERERLVA